MQCADAERQMVCLEVFLYFEVKNIKKRGGKVNHELL